MSEILNIILNGKTVKGFKGESILDLTKREGIEIPTLCHDDRLEPFTSCYLCVVEVGGMRGLQPSCSTKISEGMQIDTGNDRIFKARKTALELLLSNHFADCIGPCKQTCPAGVDVQAYISYIEKGMYEEAVSVIKETNPLPAICGRVCVRPCEVSCRRNFMDENTGVGIDYLKRYAADKDLESGSPWKPVMKAPTGKKVAIIGAGPAGVSAAFFLQKEGHQADIFEAAPKAGGWLRYGIPEYRLPNDLLQKEIDNITDLGVRIFYEQKLGYNLSYKDLKFEYDAVLLAIGSQGGTSIGCEDDDAENVLSGIDFLKTMELTGKKYDFSGKTVAVIGGGNTAMDCCRTSMRCGAEKVYVIYRRTEKEMPANPIEIHESKLEGVEYMFLTAPLKVNKDEKNTLKSLTCLKMELGEPDASGRRRPVPVEGSEFDIPLDFILAAIGQKTQADFILDVNNNIENGELKANKWGDLEADKETLQTGVKRIFAAGDGVTGPATLIQAIAQAKTAAHSINLFLSGKPVTPAKKEFISKKENFRNINKDDFKGRYLLQLRHEMPTLEPDKRNNFSEVELGYENENVAKHEAGRCLECGCNEYFVCDLKKYATQYNAVQINYSGDFNEYNVDFRHPFIEIDNNKCILCARCVRICNEVVGASALGLVNRGFKTFVAPSMGNSLTDTTCESCGMCISTCPTGAISENFYFKPGPVQLSSAESICNYCSIGCKTDIKHRKGFIMKVEGKSGIVNTDGNICRFPRFGYNIMNDASRIRKPLLKKNGKFIEIGFDEANEIIVETIKKTNPAENAFFAGARLTNEELYLIQKLARFAAGTNNIGSFHYLGRGNNYVNNSFKNVPFEQTDKASRFYLLGSEISQDNAVAGYMIIKEIKKRNIPLEIITVSDKSPMAYKADKTLVISDYYYFVKAVNHYLLSHDKENALYIRDNCKGFEEYKYKLYAENFDELCNKAGCSNKCIEDFAESFNKELNAVLIFSEKEVTSATNAELINLALLTGKLGKTASGIIVLKEKNNSHGLHDMGISPDIGIGGVPYKDNNYREKLKMLLGSLNIPENNDTDLILSLKEGLFKNIFIFGEDPLGCAKDKASMSSWLNQTEFIVVQDYFMSETAMKANLILPSSLPSEIGGSFTNTQRVIQSFEPYEELNKGPETASWKQIADVTGKLSGVYQNNLHEVFTEAMRLLPENNVLLHEFIYTSSDTSHSYFNHGCDLITKKTVEYFNSKF